MTFFLSVRVQVPTYLHTLFEDITFFSWSIHFKYVGPYLLGKYVNYLGIVNKLRKTIGTRKMNVIPSVQKSIFNNGENKN